MVNVTWSLSLIVNVDHYYISSTFQQNPTESSISCLAPKGRIQSIYKSISFLIKKHMINDYVCNS